MATDFFDILLQSRSQLSTPFAFECLMTDSFAQKGLVEVKLFDFLDKVTNATPIPAFFWNIQFFWIPEPQTIIESSSHKEWPHRGHPLQ